MVVFPFGKKLFQGHITNTKEHLQFQKMIQHFHLFICQVKCIFQLSKLDLFYALVSKGSTKATYWSGPSVETIQIVSGQFQVTLLILSGYFQWLENFLLKRVQNLNFDKVSGKIQTLSWVLQKYPETIQILSKYYLDSLI